MNAIFRGKVLSALLDSAVSAEAGLSIDDDYTAAEQNAIVEAAAILRRVRRGAVLVELTPFEAESLLKPIANSLDDPDFRRDHMRTKERNDAANRAWEALEAVAKRR